MLYCLLACLFVIRSVGWGWVGLDRIGLVRFGIVKMFCKGGSIISPAAHLHTKKEKRERLKNHL